MFCMSCGNQIPDDAAVCPSCGAPQSTQPYQQPAYDQSMYQNPYPNPAYQQPMYSQPKQKVPGKGLGIAGMVLGIIGLIYAFVFLCMYGLIDDVGAMGLATAMAEEEMIGALFGVAVMPLLGVIFGAVSRAKGSRAGTATAGIVTGSIGLAFVMMCFFMTL